MQGLGAGVAPRFPFSPSSPVPFSGGTGPCPVGMHAGLDGWWRFGGFQVYRFLPTAWAAVRLDLEGSWENGGALPFLPIFRPLWREEIFETVFRRTVALCKEKGLVAQECRVMKTTGSKRLVR